MAILTESQSEPRWEVVSLEHWRNSRLRRKLGVTSRQRPALELLEKLIEVHHLQCRLGNDGGR